MIQAKTFTDWISAQYSHDELVDMCHYGCIGGFNGLIYYTEITSLYAKYKEDIWELLADQAIQCGYDDVISFIYSVSMMQDSINSDTFENKLVWCAAELVANELT